MAVTDFLSSSSSLSLKSSRLPISAGLTLIRLARLCMSSSLRNKQTHTKTLLMINNMKLLRDNLSASNNKRHHRVKLTHVAFPSRTKTHDSDSLSVASTTLTDSGFSFSVRSVCVGVGLANRFRLMSADARTLRCPLFSCR